jgi:hypothetical protein
MAIVCRAIIQFCPFKVTKVKVLNLSQAMRLQNRCCPTSLTGLIVKAESYNICELNTYIIASTRHLNLSQACWCTPVILVIRRVRKENHEFETSLSYITRK